LALQIIGDRPHQEDRYLTLSPGALKSRKEVAVFAVFDGQYVVALAFFSPARTWVLVSTIHDLTQCSAGATVADHVAANLIQHLDGELANATEFSVETYQAAIQAALVAEDEDISREDFTGGSTVALALVDTAQKLLVAANLGDSQVVFAKRLQRNKKEEAKLLKLDQSLRAHHVSKKKNQWEVTRLSVSHDPDSPDEKKRIEDSGGEVNYDTGVPRVGAEAPH
jgi:serine/threonine protein phosphatase PrpC